MIERPGELDVTRGYANQPIAPLEHSPEGLSFEPEGELKIEPDQPLLLLTPRGNIVPMAFRVQWRRTQKRPGQ